jgi:anti-sigma factor RsiW
VAVVAGTIWLNRDLTSEELAVRALSRAPEQMEFRSGDLAELRTWVKAGTGLDIPLPGRASPSVQLVGANVTRKGPPTAEISYRVGSSDVALVVSKAPAEGEGRHTFKKGGSYHGANFQSWTMRGQMYTIAAADARVGCMLCHNTGAPRALVN